MSSYNHGPLEHELAGGTFADGSAEHGQPARDGEEWLTELRERNEERKRAFAVWKERGILTESQSMPDMITDIDRLLRVAALVPELEAMLRNLLTVVVAIQDNPDVRFSSETKKTIRDTDAVLSTITKESRQ